MQLTNIARDVGEDARNGRLYIPRSWFADVGMDADAFVARPQHDPHLATMISRLLGEADRLYDRATAGIDLLPAGCRPAIHASRLLYAEIGREVERAAHDSVGQRAVVSTGRKSLLMCSALVASVTRRNASDAPVLEEARFLADAVSAAPKPEGRPRSFDERARWLADLFMRLEKQGQ
jgi:phytoene synthase